MMTNKKNLKKKKKRDKGKRLMKKVDNGSKQWVTRGWRSDIANGLLVGDGAT